MNLHDIYDIDRNKTGGKYSYKTDYLRESNEFSLNVLLFIGFNDFVLVLKDSINNSYQTFGTLLLEGETSVRACERILYDEFRIDIDTEQIKYFSSKTIENNIYDYWIYRADLDFEKILNQNKILIKCSKEEFEQMLLNDEFNMPMTNEDMLSIFDIHIKLKVRPLVIKSNKY